MSLAADGYASPGGAVLIAVLALDEPAVGVAPHIIIDV